MNDGPTYPDPTFRYQSATQTLQPVYIGPWRVTGARRSGTNYWADPEAGAPTIRIRPGNTTITGDDPSTTAFTAFYSQYRSTPEDGVAFKMYFRITSDEAGGAVGAAASLRVTSNYPEINMDLARFPVNQPGVGRLKEAWIPADYEANLQVQVWNNDADLGIDGYIRLECGYRKTPAVESDGVPLLYSDAVETLESAADAGLVPVGRVSSYLTQCPDN